MNYQNLLFINLGAFTGTRAEFNEWRAELQKAAGFPPIERMRNFGGSIPWDTLFPSQLVPLLSHADHDEDGNDDVLWNVCPDLASEMEAILPNISRPYLATTQQFIRSARKAFEMRKNLTFR